MSSKMKLTAVLVALVTLVMILPASAQLYPYNSQFGQRIKTNASLATDRCFIAHDTITADTASATYCAVGIAATTAPVTYTATSITTQPDVARAITVDPTGTTNDVAAGSVTITGTDIAGNSISDAVTFIANATAAQTTTKAFASIATISFATQDGTGAKFDIGVANKFGLKQKFKDDAFILIGLFDGVDELSSATKAVSSTELSSNTYQTAGTCDGTKSIDVFYLIE